MLIGEQNTKILPNKAPIMVTWTPREPGATLPDGENNKLNYVDILIKHKQENNEERDIILFVNGPGFRPGQIDDLKNKFKGVDGIHVVDLHDSRYDRYWEEIDQGWQINGKPISIKEYYKNMYGMQDENRTHFAIEIDTFRYIAAYCLLREQEKQERDLGVIYIDFDALKAICDNRYKRGLRKFLYNRSTEQKGIGQNIKIPHGILAECIEDGKEKKCMNNDVFAVTDPCILKEIFNKYTGDILDLCKMVQELQRKMKENLWPIDDLYLPGKDLSSTSPTELLDTLALSRYKGIFLHDLNLGWSSFKKTVNEMMKDKSFKSFDFVENGGEHFAQLHGAKNDISWLSSTKKKEKNEQFSEQSTDPSTLLDVKSDVISSDTKSIKKNFTK